MTSSLTFILKLPLLCYNGILFEYSVLESVHDSILPKCCRKYKNHIHSNFFNFYMCMTNIATSHTREAVSFHNRTSGGHECDLAAFDALEAFVRAFTKHFTKKHLKTTVHFLVFYINILDDSLFESSFVATEEASYFNDRPNVEVVVWGEQEEILGTLLLLYFPLDHLFPRLNCQIVT